MKIDHGLLLIPLLHFSVSLPLFPFPGPGDQDEGRNGYSAAFMRRSVSFSAIMRRMLKPGLPTGSFSGAQRFILPGRQIMTGYMRPGTFTIINFQSN